MWSSLLLLLTAGTVLGLNGPWEPNTEYRYQIHSRTYTGIPDLRQQYAVVISRGQLVLQTPKTKDANVLVGQLQKLEHASYNGDVPAMSPEAIPRSNLQYKPSNMNGKKFQVYLVQGTVQRVEVDKSFSNDEVNQLKGILSQLQANTQGKNLLAYPNTLPAQFKNGVASGHYVTMEASVTGNCETIYDIAPIADYALPNSIPHFGEIQSTPEGKPAFQIVKTTNYSNCVQNRGYHYGVSSYNVHSNKVGQFMSRELENRIVAFGTPADFTIYYSQSSMRVSVAPEFYQKQKAVTTSSVELYLTKSSQYQTPMTAPDQPQNVGNLVYRYNIPSDRTNAARVGLDKYNRLTSYPKNAYNAANQFSDNSSPEGDSNERQGDYAESNQRSYKAGQTFDNFWQPSPTKEQPAENPFLPYYVGRQGHAIRFEIDMVSQMKTLAVEISTQMENASHIPYQHVLEKFNILVGLVASAPYSDITKVASALKSSSQTNNNGYSEAWRVFQDAVILGGSTPTTTALLESISAGYMSDDDAIAALLIQPKVLRTPTKDILNAYFNFIKSESMLSRPQVYSAALLSFTEIAGHAYSNYWYARNYYPEDSYGQFGPQLTDIVENQLIPYINKSLKAAFDAKNDRDFLMYIRAYGNLEHPSYLSMFKEYYERPEPISVFQRSALLMAMDYLMVRHHQLVRPVFYKIYMNTGEHPDVRSVAALFLIGSNPPNAMLQEIAVFTNEDPSIQVQSVVKHSLESIAQLNSPADQQRAANAKAALQFLNPRSYDSGYSHSLIFDEVLKSLNYNRHRHLSIFTSNNAAVPSMVRMTVYDMFGGIYKPFFHVSSSVSNVGDLLKRFRWPEGSNSNNSPKFVITNVTTQNNEIDGLPQIPLPVQAMQLINDFQSIMFNEEFSPAPQLDNVHTHNPFKPAELNPDDRTNERIQGHSQHWLFGGCRYNAYDQKAINNLPQFLDKVFQSYKNGREINFSKFYKEDTVTIAFPLASGYPYVFTWDTPTLVQMHGNVTVKTSSPLYDGKTPVVNIPEALNISTHAHILYSRNHITQAGFVTPFSGKHYVTGHVRRVMYNLPIYFDINVDLINHSVNGALMPVGQAVLGHFSSVPYTAEKDAFSTVPDTANQPGVRIIQTRQPKRVQRQLGEKTTGLLLSVTGEYETPRNVYGPLPYLVGGLPKSGLVNAFLQPTEGVEHYYVQVSYSDKNTKTDGLRFGFAMKSGVIRKPNKNYSDALQEYLLERKKRESQVFDTPAYYPGTPHQGIAFLQSIDKLFDLITPSMTNGKATVVSAYVALAGPGTQTVYEAVGAYSSSRPNGLIRISGGFRRNELNYFNEKQYCFEMNIKEPGNQYYAMSGIDTASKAGREVGMEFRFTVGPDCVMSDQHPNNTALVGVAVMNQTTDYRQYLLNSQYSLQCKDDVSAGNFQTPACRKSIRDLRVPNYLSFHMEQTGSKRFVPDLLKIFAWTQRNPIVKNTILSQRDIKESSGNFMLGPDSKYYDGTIQYGNGRYQVHDLEVSPLVRSVAFGEQIHDQLPYKKMSPRNSVCVVDNSQIVTFDGTIIDKSLGGCAYTVAQTFEPEYTSGNLPQESPAHVRDMTIMMSNRLSEPYRREVSVNFYTDKQGTTYTLRLYGNGKQRRPEAVIWKNDSPTDVRHYQHVEVEADGVVRVHVHPQTSTSDNVVVADFNDGSMRIVFNGQWLRIEADYSYRGKLRGLCGTNDLEKYTDLQSPRHCVYQDTKDFISSWANPDELVFCQPEVKQAVTDAQNKQCYPIKYLPNSVVNSKEASSSFSNQAQSDYGHLFNHAQMPQYGHQATSTSCQLREQIQYVDSRGQVCFTTEPLAACPQNCQAVHLKQRSVSVQCYHQNDPRTRALIQAINKGQTKLNWGSNAVQRNVDFQIPSSCRSY